MCDQGGIFSVAGQKMTSTVVIFHRPIEISSVLLPPETRKNQKRVEPSPPYRKKLPFQVESVPPCQVKEGRSGGQRMVKRTYIRKYFPDLSFLWLPENQAVQQGRSVRRMNWRHPLLQHILWPLPCTGLFPAVPRNS